MSKHRKWDIFEAFHGHRLPGPIYHFLVLFDKDEEDPDLCHWMKLEVKIVILWQLPPGPTAASFRGAVRNAGAEIQSVVECRLTRSFISPVNIAGVVCG